MTESGQARSAVNVDWRTIEDKLLRQAAKAKSFRELYGGGSAEREQHCPACKHPWDDHAVDGCQAPVRISGGWYDCNCMNVRSRTGRMSVAPPPYHPVRTEELRDL